MLIILKDIYILIYHFYNLSHFLMKRSVINKKILLGKQTKLWLKFVFFNNHDKD